MLSLSFKSHFSVSIKKKKIEASGLRKCEKLKRASFPLEKLQIRGFHLKPSEIWSHRVNKEPEIWREKGDCREKSVPSILFLETNDARWHINWRTPESVYSLPSKPTKKWKKYMMRNKQDIVHQATKMTPERWGNRVTVQFRLSTWPPPALWETLVRSLG